MRSGPFLLETSSGSCSSEERSVGEERRAHINELFRTMQDPFFFQALYVLPGFVCMRPEVAGLAQTIEPIAVSGFLVSTSH